MARRRSLTKQMSLRDMLLDDDQNQERRENPDVAEGDSCIAQCGTAVRPSPQTKSLSRRQLQRSASNRKICRRGSNSNTEKLDRRRSFSRTSSVADENQSGELSVEDGAVSESTVKTRSQMSNRKADAQQKLLSKPDLRRSPSKTSCALVDSGSSEFPVEELSPQAPSKEEAAPTRRKLSSPRKSMRKSSSQKGLRKPELRRSSSKTTRSAVVTDEKGLEASSPRKSTSNGSTRALSPTKSFRKSNSQRIKSQRLGSSSKPRDKEWDSGSPVKQQQLRKQNSLRNANFQRTKSEFRRSQTLPSPPVDGDDDDYHASLTEGQTNRMFLRSCSSLDYDFGEDDKEENSPARISQRQRPEGITKVDWKKEVLREGAPAEAQGLAKESKSLPRVGVKALAKVANLFSSNQEVDAIAG